MNYISDVLFWISTGMLVPVIILLIFFFLKSLAALWRLSSGRYLQSASQAEIREQMNTLTLDKYRYPGRSGLPKNKQVIISYMKKLVDNRQSKAQVNRILDQYAQFVEKDLSLLSTLLKMGPMLGFDGYLDSDGSCPGRSFYRVILLRWLTICRWLSLPPSGIILCSHRFRNQADQEPLVYRGYEQPRVYGRPCK